MANRTYRLTGSIEVDYFVDEDDVRDHHALTENELIEEEMWDDYVLECFSADFSYLDGPNMTTQSCDFDIEDYEEE